MHPNDDVANEEVVEEAIRIKMLLLRLKKMPQVLRHLLTMLRHHLKAGAAEVIADAIEAGGVAETDEANDLLHLA